MNTKIIPVNIKNVLGVNYMLRITGQVVVTQHNYKSHIAFQGVLSKDQISIFAVPPVAIFIVRLKK